jgi:hypothetical protein
VFQELVFCYNYGWLLLLAGSDWLSPLGTATTIGLLYQSQMMIVIVVQLVEWSLAGETEVLGENLPQYHFAHHKSHDLTRARTRAVAVGSRRLTAWAMARPNDGCYFNPKNRSKFHIRIMVFHRRVSFLICIGLLKSTWSSILRVCDFSQFLQANVGAKYC